MSEHDLERLERLAAGTLADRHEAEALAHLDECVDCRAWADTYRLFSETLAADTAGASHPSSEQLAQFAVDPLRLTEPERERVETHLRACLPCRQQAMASRDAVAEARETQAASTKQPTHGFATPLRLAIAASLLLMLGIAWVVTQPPGPAAQATTQERTLSSETFHGTQLIESEGTLIANSVKVESDGELTLRAGEVVVLSDGFTVGNGGRLRIELGLRSEEPDSDSV